MIKPGMIKPGMIKAGMIKPGMIKADLATEASRNRRERFGWRNWPQHHGPSAVVNIPEIAAYVAATRRRVPRTRGDEPPAAFR